MFRKIINRYESKAFAFLILMFVMVSLVNSDFLTGESVVNCFNDSVVFTLLAVGSAFVILTGEIDVSVGSVLGISAAVAATALRDGSSVFTAISLAILVGAFFGFVNGIGVAVLKIPSLIFTLGTYGVARGMVYVYTGGAWVENLPAWFTSASHSYLCGYLTWYYVLAIIFVIFVQFLLSHTKKGHNFIAVGDNYQGAELVGINPTQTKIYAYVISGVFASVAGLIFTSRIGFITPMSGNSYEMKAIAACVLGGISLSGGLGTLIGAAIGAVIMTSITRILVFLGLSSNYDNTITGIILIVIVVVNTIIQNREIVKSRREISLKRIAQKAFIDNQEVSK
ncbi:MAG: hypothetical protein SPK65_04110 [Succinivibrio dextrinosolvens]|nr:hypothetical protein [Succinivibrio dextrinosolvens]